MSQITTTQEIRRSHTSPTRVQTSPIPADTSINPFSPLSLRIATELHAQEMAENVLPTRYPGTEGSQFPSHYLPGNKGKQKETPPHTPSRQPIFPEQPGGDGDDEPGDEDDDNGQPPFGPPGPPPPPL